MFKNILLMILVAGALTLILSGGEKEPVIDPVIIPEEIVETPPVISLCFYKETPAEFDSSLFDTASLRMNLSGGNVTGEFKNFPAQTDSNFGAFEGTVTPVIPEMMARIADVWWNSQSEGMTTKRELRIIFGEGTASVGFGELSDRGDGVYVYTDKENIETWVELTDVACSDLGDREIVADYIRKNIVSLVPEEPVLGGTFYALKVSLNPSLKTGVFNYEDGHIMGSASFSYERNGENVTITNIEKVN
jgi:hypothetical protein